MSSENGKSSVPPASCYLLALGFALVMIIFGGFLFLVGSVIYAAWSVHWSIGVVVAVLVLLISISEGTAAKYGDHTQW